MSATLQIHHYAGLLLDTMMEGRGRGNQPDLRCFYTRPSNRRSDSGSGQIIILVEASSENKGHKGNKGDNKAAEREGGELPLVWEADKWRRFQTRKKEHHTKVIDITPNGRMNQHLLKHIKNTLLLFQV
jgi:hypothetical protein